MTCHLMTFIKIIRELKYNIDYIICIVFIEIDNVVPDNVLPDDTDGSFLTNVRRVVKL